MRTLKYEKINSPQAPHIASLLLPAFISHRVVASLQPAWVRAAFTENSFLCGRLLLVLMSYKGGICPGRAYQSEISIKGYNPSCIELAGSPEF